MKMCPNSELGDLETSQNKSSEGQAIVSSKSKSNRPGFYLHCGVESHLANIIFSSLYAPGKAQVTPLLSWREGQMCGGVFPPKIGENNTVISFFLQLCSQSLPSNWLLRDIWKFLCPLIKINTVFHFRGWASSFDQQKDLNLTQFWF